METKRKVDYSHMRTEDLISLRDKVTLDLDEARDEYNVRYAEKNEIEWELDKRRIVPELDVVLQAVKDALKQFNLPYDIQVIDLYKNIVIVMKKP